MPQLHSQTQQLTRSFIDDKSQDAAYIEFEAKLSKVPFPTNETEFTEYKKTLSKLLKTSLNVIQIDNEVKASIPFYQESPLNQSIRKLESYLGVLEKKLPSSFLLDENKKSQNPRNAKILQTRLVIKDLLTQLAQKGTFELSPANLNLINEKEQLKDIVSKLSEITSPPKPVNSSTTRSAPTAKGPEKKIEKPASSSVGNNPNIIFSDKANPPEDKNLKKKDITPPTKPYRSTG